MSVYTPLAVLTMPVRTRKFKNGFTAYLVLPQHIARQFGLSKDDLVEFALLKVTAADKDKVKNEVLGKE